MYQTAACVLSKEDKCALHVPTQKGSAYLPILLFYTGPGCVVDQPRDPETIDDVGEAFGPKCFLVSDMEKPFGASN
jgi:hypothetical protein